MADVTMRQMLEAGVHFGHQTRYWNPKMAPFIFGERNKIHIINLEKSLPLAREASAFVKATVADGGTVLFVGTKKQARESIYEEANRCEMFYVHNRWLGGMLTNYQTIKKGIDRLNYLTEMTIDGSINRFPKKEMLRLEKERVKLDNNLGGIRNMSRLPKLLFVVDIMHAVLAEHDIDPAVAKLNDVYFYTVDDLQDVIALVKGLDYRLPLQYVNYRD